jgi:putative RNA 2'-phosphotransferase
MVENVELSKLLSLVLRHQPGYIGLSLNEQGWANVEVLIEKLNQKGVQVTFEMLQLLVLQNDKKRFSFNEDESLIRANQGHSIQVDLGLQPVSPPQILFHGTVAKFCTAIRQYGLAKMDRQFVHLSANTATAIVVAKRRGQPVVLEIAAGEMHNSGYIFYLSKNGVWLTDNVPVTFIKFPQ